MDMKWYKFEAECPDCQSPLGQFRTEYSADGELRFSLFCMKCQQASTWTVFASNLFARAMANDLIQHLEDRIGKKPKPQKATEQLLNSDDIGFLRELHIRTEDIQ